MIDLQSKGKGQTNISDGTMPDKGNWKHKQSFQSGFNWFWWPLKVCGMSLSVLSCLFWKIYSFFQFELIVELCKFSFDQFQGSAHLSLQVSFICNLCQISFKGFHLDKSQSSLDCPSWAIPLINFFLSNRRSLQNYCHKKNHRALERYHFNLLQSLEEFSS